MSSTLEERSIEVRGKGSGIFIRVFIGGNTHLLEVGGQTEAPLLILHGGPGLPHDYLIPIASMVPNRATVFYDQLGCGRSSAPVDPHRSTYSIWQSVEDLHQVINGLKLSQFVLFGHSWGGILAYEFLRSRPSSAVLGLILANTSTSAELTRREISQIMGKLIMSGVRNEDLDSAFKSRYLCSVNSPELRLAEQRQTRVAHWCGLDSIEKWAIQTDQHFDVPVAVFRGENDFSGDYKSTARWNSVFSGPFVEMVFSGSSHMPHLERPHEFKEALLHFLSGLKK
jgi:proline iminopeptidase